MPGAARSGLPTIWEVPDDLWTVIAKILGRLDPPSPTGRPRIDQRKALNGVIYQLRSGVQWNHLPREFGDDSSVHRTFQRWVQLGVFKHIWARLVRDCDELGGVNWRWQCVDGSMSKARFGGTASAATPPTAASPE